MTKISAALHVKQATKRKTRSNVASAGRGINIPLAPPVMLLHSKASLRFSSPFRRTTYTRTAGFCLWANPDFQRVARQNPPVLLMLERLCSARKHPLSSVSGRQRYNTLDFARKVVCHETAGFIGLFLPLKGAALHWMPPAKAAPPPLETTAKGCGSPVATSKCL